MAELVSHDGWLTLMLDEQPALGTDIVTRLSRIELRDDGIDLETRGDGTIAPSAQATGKLWSAKFDGRAVPVAQGGVALPAMATPRRLELRWK